MADPLHFNLEDGGYWACKEPERPFDPDATTIHEDCPACRIYLHAVARQTPAQTLLYGSTDDPTQAERFTAAEAAARWPLPGPHPLWLSTPPVGKAVTP